MGSDKIYRWQKRREKRRSQLKSFHIDILDGVILALLFIVIFISLRLFFIFEVIKSPCAEMIYTAGQSSGLPPIFELTFSISLLIGVFWLCVTFMRIQQGRKSWGLISWHIVVFITIFFMSLMNWNLTTPSYVKPPDGIMVVENIVPDIKPTGIDWPLANSNRPDIITWERYENGQWYARVILACIWLDENKVSYNDRFDITRDYRSAVKLLLKRRYAQTMIDNQLYRPLSEYERERFFGIKACQTDITRYGQHASACTSTWLYPVKPGLEPPPHIKELFSDP